jgi:hypothetical protein
MIEPYRPEHYDEVRAFARRLPNFDYVKHIIRAHTEQHAPGGCWIWRESLAPRPSLLAPHSGLPIVAFCAMLYMNRDDAWLYGMRVDPRCKDQGIATKFTRRLFRIARASGHTWAGLNTLDHREPAPVFRIAEKLGMRLEAVHATEPYWGLPRRFARPRLRRMPDSYRQLSELGLKVVFTEDPGWLWFRILPARRSEIARIGYELRDVPVLVRRHPPEWEGRRVFRRVSVNLCDRPADFRPLLQSLFGFATGPGRSLILNYPAEWRRELHAAVRDLLPRTLRGRHYWYTVWRIYGKQL